MLKLFFTFILVNLAGCVSTGTQERARNAGLRKCTVRDVIDDNCSDNVREARYQNGTEHY